MKDLLSLYCCNCGRSWCQFFSPAEDEYGVSYSVEDVEELIELLPKLEKHLKNELRKYKSTHSGSREEE